MKNNAAIREVKVRPSKSLLAVLLMALFSFSFVGSVSAINYTIEYKENTVSNMPDSVLRGLSSSTSASLSNNAPTRNGFRFLGWCDQATTKSGDIDTCASGHQHQPGGTIALDATTNLNYIKLYAIWGLPYTLQEFAAGTANTTCSAMSTGDSLILIDSRDQNQYSVGKLADGRCWMLDNLNLDLTSSAVLNSMNQNNTNASNTTLGYLKGASTGTTSDKYATSAVTSWTSSHSYSAPLVNMTKSDVVPTTYNGTDDPMASSVSAGNWKVGGYYNYCAATAGSYCYGDGGSEGSSYGNATEDICPKGWRLPTGNSSGEYATLARAVYGSTGYSSNATYITNYRSALHMPLSGYIYDGSAYYYGNYGYFWTSTRSNDIDMRDLYISIGEIDPTYSNYRIGGYSIRCIMGS